MIGHVKTQTERGVNGDGHDLLLRYFSFRADKKEFTHVLLSELSVLFILKIMLN